MQDNKRGKMEEKYRKIELFKTYNFAKDHKEINKLQNSIEKVLKENNIEYILEVIEEKKSFAKILRTVYTLRLVIRSIDLENTKYFLNTVENLNYNVLEEEKILQDTENDNYEENPIKNEEDENTSFDKLDKNSMEYAKLQVSRIFLIFLCASIIFFEIVLMIYSIMNTGEYKDATIILIIILIEIPFIKNVGKFLQRDGEIKISNKKLK